MLLDCDNGRLAIIGLTGNLYGGLLAEQAKNLASRRRFVVNDQDAELRRRTHWESWGMCAEVCRGTLSVTCAPPLRRLEIENC